MNPRVHRRDGLIFRFEPCKVAIQLNTFTPVGMAIIIVAAVK